MGDNPDKLDNIAEAVDVNNMDEPEILVTRFGGYPDLDDQSEQEHVHVIDVPIKTTMDSGEEGMTKQNDVKISIPEHAENENFPVTANNHERLNNKQNVSQEALVVSTHNCQQERKSSWRVSTFKGWTKDDIKWLEKSEARFREVAGSKGNISLEQFTKALGVKRTSFYAERIFKLLDQDDNGKLELGELFDGLHMLTKGSPCEKLKFLFDLYDKDGNGYIDYDELQQVLKACIEESSMHLTDENFEDLTAAMFDAMDKDNDGMIAFDELRDTLEKQPEVLNNLTIGAVNLLRPAETDHTGAYSRYLTKEYLLNNCRKVGYFFVYWLLNIVLFAVAMWLYRDYNTWMMKTTQKTRLKENQSPIQNIYFTTACTDSERWWTLFEFQLYVDPGINVTELFDLYSDDSTVTCVASRSAYNVPQNDSHCNSDICNNTYTSTHSECSYCCRREFNGDMGGVVHSEGRGGICRSLGGSAFITGWLLDIVLIIMVICSLPSVRRGGHFQIFYWTHLLYVPFWILVILHGPHFWKWFVGPGVIFLLEKISRSKAFRLVRHGETFIKEVNLLPSRVTHLVIDRPVSFRYKPGDYLFLQIPAIAKHEWHPFTISSAPEMEGHIWLHIRSAGHWTNKLYDYFDNLEYFDHEEDTKIEKENNNTFEEFEKAYVQRATRMNTSTFRSRNTSKPKQNHKKVAIKCFLDGPYGTGTREVFDTDHAILVGAGIGITPMASILQSVWYKFSATRKECPRCHHVWLPDDSNIKLKKVDFIWVNRDQKCFEWFVSLLKQMEHEQNQHDVLENRIQIHMYMTSAQKKTDMKGIGLQVALDLMYDKSQSDLITGLRTKTQPGRPDWEQIFNDVKQENKGKVKVFVCGPPTLAKSLKETATKHKFAFSKENF